MAGGRGAARREASAEDPSGNRTEAAGEVASAPPAGWKVRWWWEAMGQQWQKQIIHENSGPVAFSWGSEDPLRGEWGGGVRGDLGVARKRARLQAEPAPRSGGGDSRTGSRRRDECRGQDAGSVAPLTTKSIAGLGKQAQWGRWRAPFSAGHRELRGHPRRAEPAAATTVADGRRAFPDAFCADN